MTTRRSFRAFRNVAAQARPRVTNRIGQVVVSKGPQLVGPIVEGYRQLLHELPLRLARRLHHRDPRNCSARIVAHVPQAHQMRIRDSVAELLVLIFPVPVLPAVELNRQPRHRCGIVACSTCAVRQVIMRRRLRCGHRFPIAHRGYRTGSCNRLIRPLSIAPNYMFCSGLAHVPSRKRSAR